MSKENALSFLRQAATNPELKSQIQQVEAAGELVNLGQIQGYEFSSENVREIIPVLKEQKGFLGDLAEAILELFGPTHDDYPATGVQAFTGDLPSRH
ncbi:MAG: Nif11-like leader peptide family natural product precursor [Nodosilinea sp. LVE1205-7]|jgi:predicted ribosomally synthesized peptide with nif11-like leader